ncbi:methyltransferase [Gymnodinialimonas sp. 2305UL16-5]|uniref:tRNA1(Val) (adenine(37)-N6)-methyltransferase n=1 Tax=Gymnodinialimonas mytili TaxID=3126503 RepID=UPI0030992411
MLDDDALTHDAFLGGEVQAWQPKRGYRAGVDPVLLAAACPAQPGDSVLDLGCGVGVAGLCVAARVTGVVLRGVERQPHYAALAARNGVDVTCADLADLPTDMRRLSFDHVIMNPPYYGQGTASEDAGRTGALREDTPLPVWGSVARARLRPKGWLTLIHMAERLPDVLAALDGFGDIAVRPLAPRTGRDATRIVLRARKSSRGTFRLLAPILIHEGDTHLADGDDYSATARAILRDCAPLVFE